MLVGKNKKRNQNKNQIHIKKVHTYITRHILQKLPNIMKKPKRKPPRVDSQKSKLKNISKYLRK